MTKGDIIAIKNSSCCTVRKHIYNFTQEVCIHLHTYFYYITFCWILQENFSEILKLNLQVSNFNQLILLINFTIQAEFSSNICIWFFSYFAQWFPNKEIVSAIIMDNFLWNTTIPKLKINFWTNYLCNIYKVDFCILKLVQKVICKI